jgi:hypothetical protein
MGPGISLSKATEEPGGGHGPWVKTPPVLQKQHPTLYVNVKENRHSPDSRPSEYPPENTRRRLLPATENCH